MKYGYFIVLSLVFFTLLQGTAANTQYYYEYHHTHIDMSSSFTAHQGDVKEIKAELYGDDRSSYGLLPDSMLDKKMLYLNVYGPPVDGNNLYIENSAKTNWWGNAYFKLDTKNLEPGKYNITVYFNGTYPVNSGSVYLPSTKKATLTVLPKK